MDRREFMKSMLALGVSVSLPWIDLSSASAAQIDLELEKLTGQLFYFEVNDSGTLSTEGVDFPSTRGECRGLEIYDFQSVSSVITFLDNESCSDCVARHYLVGKEIEGDPYDVDLDELEDWLNEHPDNLEIAQQEVQKWLDSTDLDETDYESANLRGLSAQGSALCFFRDTDFEINESLGIVIVEGDRPGSSYFAAELRTPIHEANEIADMLDLPYRFKT